MMSKRRSVIALGMFDGVHLGHRELLNFAVRLAKENDAASIAYTFSNHPKNLWGNAPKLLNTMRERRDHIQALGVEKVHFQQFDSAFASLSPTAFVEFLMKSYHIFAMVAGYDFSFGGGARGHVDTLQMLGQACQFAVHVIPPVQYAGCAISSSRIRECIEMGDIQTANSMLGMPYAISGIVHKNKRIGTHIGFPTVNILPQKEKVLPKFGVYVSTVEWNKICYPAVTNIGSNPTVGGGHVSIETHLLDFDGDLYDERIDVKLHKWLRGEKKFAGQQELAQQIQTDVDQARSWLLYNG